MSSLDINPRGRQAVIISIVFSFFASITVCLRLYTRLFVVRCPGVEDYCILVSLLCSIGLSTCICIQAKHGMGRHIWELQPVDSLHSLKAFYASLIVYYLSLGFTKISILIQYKRVFTTKKFRIACYIIMGVVVTYAFWTVFSSIFGCKPIQAFWTLKPPFKCLNQFAVWFFNGAMNILTDLTIIVLPMPVIRKLNLPRRQKQALIGIFAIGGFVCLVSILRLQSLVAISNSDDPTYDNPPAATWSSVEINVGIICSCLPCLRPLITRYLPGVFSTGTNRSGHTGGSEGSQRRAKDSTNSNAETDATTIQLDKSEDALDWRPVEDRESIIRVVTEFHVTVEKKRKSGVSKAEEV